MKNQGILDLTSLEKEKENTIVHVSHLIPSLS